MKNIEEFLCRFDVHEHIWIPMDDGKRLSARIWIPEGAEQNPVPAIFEFIPYRKRDFTRMRDNGTHNYFAGHGYACIRVDLRGSGESEDFLEDEYTQRELDDGVQIMRWLADQSWCNGKVGMIGISWGGFNGLQIAALRPPELKAVITIASTDDRYADDIHHMGGCLLGDNLSWASVMFSINAFPPDPALVGAAWRDMWHTRLEGSGLWLEKWLHHQRRDDYWKHGSVCQDYDAIKCPVMAVSGWADGYSNAVFRMIDKLNVPRQGLVGPWSHKYPHLGAPGPAIGFLQEALRWWDYWLKEKQTGIMDEPMLRAYMQDSVPPATSYKTRPGRWVGETHWPAPHCEKPHCYRLTPHRLVPDDSSRTKQEAESQDDLTMQILSPATHGLFGGKWCSYAASPDLPGDQRRDDGGALVFETEPLAEDTEILGAPVVALTLSAAAPVAMAAVRLIDVAPDGRATRITYGLLNLTHRDSHEHPEALIPGETYRVKIQMNEVAQKFPAGHKIRLSISSSYWPLAWLPPEPAALTIDLGASKLMLPVRPPQDRDQEIKPFAPPEQGMPPTRTCLEPPHYNWEILYDLGADSVTLKVSEDDGCYQMDEHGLISATKTSESYSCTGDDFLSLRGEVQSESRFSREDWSVRTNTHTILTADKTHFYIKARLTAYEGADEVFNKTWDTKIKRDLV